jgi:WD40 repeat protein
MKPPAFKPFRPSGRPKHAYFAGALSMGLVVLSSLSAQAQPPQPPPPIGSKERMEQLRADMRARVQAAIAARPPRVESRTLSPDGKWAVSYSTDGSVTLWDAATGKDVRTIERYAASEGYISGTPTFSPDSKLLFTTGTIRKEGGDGPAQFIDVPAANGGVIKAATVVGQLWDVATGTLLWKVSPKFDGQKFEFALGHAAFSRDGKLLATKGTYDSISLWDTSTGQVLRTLPTPFINMQALAFSPDGKTLAGGGYRTLAYSSEILLWDVQSGELERSLKESSKTKQAEVTTIAFSPDGKKLALGGAVGQFERINEISGRFNNSYGMAQLWDVKSGVLLAEIGRPIHRVRVTTLAFSPDGARLATGSEDKTVGLWDVQTYRSLGDATFYGADGDGGEIRELDMPGVGVKDVTFSPDGKSLKVLTNNKVVKSWDVSAPRPQSDPIRQLLPGGGSRYSAIAFAPNSYWLVSGEYGKRVRFWTVNDRQETNSFIAHADPVVKVAVAPLAADEPRGSKVPLLATASTVLQWRKTGENTGGGFPTGSEVKLWNSENQELQRTLQVPGLSVTALAVSPRGQWVAVAGGKFGPLPRGAVGGNGLFHAAVGGPENADNPADATQTKSGVVMVWDAFTGELKQRYDIAGGMPTDLKFSSDGSKLVCDGEEAGVILWDTATGAEIRTLDEDRPAPLKPGERRMSFYIGDPKGQSTLALIGDGNLLARSRKGSMKIWNVKVGAVETTLTDAENKDQSAAPIIAISPDGKTLAMTSRLQGFTLWDVTTGQLLWRSPSKERIEIMEMAPNGKTLATSSGNEIRLWDITKVGQGIVN